MGMLVKYRGHLIEIGSYRDYLEWGQEPEQVEIFYAVLIDEEFAGDRFPSHDAIEIAKQIIREEAA